MFEIWLDLIKNNSLGGYESKNEFSTLQILKYLIN